MKINVINQNYSNNQFTPKSSLQSKQNVSFKKLIPVKNFEKLAWQVQNRTSENYREYVQIFNKEFVQLFDNKSSKIPVDGRDLFLDTGKMYMNAPTLVPSAGKKDIDLNDVVSVKVGVVSRDNSVQLAETLEHLSNAENGNQWWIDRILDFLKNDEFTNSLLSLCKTVAAKKQIMNFLLDSAEKRHSLYPALKLYKLNFPGWRINVDGFNKLTTEDACKDFYNVMKARPKNLVLDRNGNVNIALAPEKM